MPGIENSLDPPRHFCPTHGHAPKKRSGGPPPQLSLLGQPSPLEALTRLYETQEKACEG